jgi:hypothetical protein
MHRQLIGDKETPLWGYNHAAVRNDAARRRGCRLSAQMIRSRAKERVFYIPKIKKEKSLSREVVTEEAGMLLQYDYTGLWFNKSNSERGTMIGGRSLPSGSMP